MLTARANADILVLDCINYAVLVVNPPAPEAEIRPLSAHARRIEAARPYSPPSSAPNTSCCRRSKMDRLTRALP